MKCLVTGGAGFIGSHLCDRLVADGHEVMCIDNLITGNKKNISQLFKSPNFTFIEHDCVMPLPENVRADLIYHLASPASPPKYQSFPIETLLVNTIGTYHLLEKAKDWRAILVFASTSEVYGEPKEHPQKESYWGYVNPNGERSCYDEGKRAGEAFVAAYVRKFGVDGRTARIFNTYGPRMDINDGRVVTNFIKEIISNSPITVHGDGSQTRSFCYVSDLVEGLVAMGKTPATRGKVANLGNPSELTILDLAKKLQSLTGYHGNFVYDPLPADDPSRRRPDTTLARKLFGWEPQIDLDHGLRLTLGSFNVKIP